MNRRGGSLGGEVTRFVIYNLKSLLSGITFRSSFRCWRKLRLRPLYKRSLFSVDRLLDPDLISVCR